MLVAALVTWAGAWLVAYLVSNASKRRLEYSTRTEPGGFRAASLTSVAIYAAAGGLFPKPPSGGKMRPEP